MSRSLNGKLLAIGTAVALLSLSQGAFANLFLDIQADPSSPGYSSTTPRAISFTSAQASDVFVLDVYALITPNGANTATATSEQLSSLAANFFVASSLLKGDVTAGSFNTSVVSTGTSVLGASFTSSYGGLGLGGSSSTDATGTHWYYASSGVSPATNGTVLPGNAGTEYLLGTIKVSFGNSAYTLPASTTTAQIGSVPYYGASQAATKKYNWVQDTVGTGSLGGSNSLVANGPMATSLINSSLGVMSFTLVTSNTGSPAIIGASLAINGTTVGLGGSSLALTGNVGNTAASGANALNWTASLPSSVTVTPSSANGVAGGASSALTGTLVLPANNFGPYTAAVSFNGTDASAGTPAIGSPVATPLAATIIGKGTTGGADGTGTPGASYGIALTTQSAVTNLAGLTTTLGSAANTFGIGKTSATILAGALTTAGSIGETWRSRASTELPTPGTHAAGYNPLYSDVVNLTGVTTGNPYVLQMTYAPDQLGGTTAASAAASGGFLFLGYRDGTGAWVNAVKGNTGNNTFSEPIIGSFASFTAAQGTSNLASLMGAWGVDPTTNTVWSVLNHDAEFAAVPEPGTIALLVGGLLAMGVAYRRRLAK